MSGRIVRVKRREGAARSGAKASKSAKAIASARVSSSPQDLEDQIERAMEALAQADQANDYTADLRSESDIMKMEPPTWLIEGWLPRKGVAALYGEPGIGKTLLLLAWTKLVQRGEPWRGLRVQRGPVLFIEGETLDGFRPRFAAFNRSSPLPDGTSEALALYRGEPINLNNRGAIAAVIRTAEALSQEAGEPVVMVVIEPLIENMSGDENTDGMEEASRALRVIAEILGCCVVVGHHSNAEGTRERGNQKLRARVHTMVRMEYLTDDAVGLVVQKQRNGEHRAMRLLKTPVPKADSIVLTPMEELPAQDYARQKVATARDAKNRRADEQAEDKDAFARELILKAAPTGSETAVSKTDLLTSAKGHSVGHAGLSAALDALVSADKISSKAGRTKSDFKYWRPV